MEFVNVINFLCFCLAEKAGLQTDTFLEVMSNTNLRSDLIMDKGLGEFYAFFKKIVEIY